MAKRGFLDGYETYDPEREGYGRPSQWRAAFRQRMSPDEARRVLNDDSPLAVLGVTARSTWTEIRSAYRRLAIQWHPDRCRLPNAEEMMKKINAAFDLLADQYGKV